MGKLLSEYIKVLNSLLLNTEGSEDSVVTNLSNDSRELRDGGLFVAIKGAQADGHEFIDQAIENGAKSIVYHLELTQRVSGISYVKVKDPYFAYSKLCEKHFDYPAANLKLIGITGTNGKTSSVCLLRDALKALGKNCALISTVAYEFGGESLPAARTTPEAYELQELFLKAKNADCEYLAMELSSHALDQHRMGTAKFAVGIFSNLSGDHLDYHLDMENYFQAKRRLFSEYLDENGIMIVNIDDPYGQRLANDPDLPARKLTFGQSSSHTPDCEISDWQTSPKGSDIELKLFGEILRFQSNLIGEHNVYNLTGVAFTLKALGIDNESLIRALELPAHIPGRLESYQSSKGATIFVDYAHTDDALANVLRILGQITRGRLLVLFGCGGDRDRKKRPRMAAVAAEFADIIVLTSDNPRSEDPLEIISEIKSGLPDKHEPIEIPDRREAIRKIIDLAEDEDVVLIAGKGHETYQEVKGEFFPFDDRKLVKEILKIL